MLKVFKEKITSVPKSGELWCEGARIYMNLKLYDQAESCLKYAIAFTPKYG